MFIGLSPSIAVTLGFSRSTLKKKPSLSFVTSPTHICLFSPISLSFSLLSTWPAHLPTSLFSFLILGGFEVHLFLFFRWTAGKHLWTERTVNLWLYSHWAKEMKGEACVSSIVVLKVHFLKEHSHKLLYKVLNHLLLKHKLAAFLGYKSQKDFKSLCGIVPHVIQSTPGFVSFFFPKKKIQPHRSGTFVSRSVCAPVKGWTCLFSVSPNIFV